MAKHCEEPLDFATLKSDVIKRRQAEWSELFDRYGNIGEDEGGSIRTGNSDDELEEEEDVDYEEEDVDYEEEYNEDDEKGSRGSDLCIEVSSDDEGQPEFVSTFKNYCGQRMETWERLREEHATKNEHNVTKTNNGIVETSSSVSTKVMEKDSGSRMSSNGPPGTFPIFNALPHTKNVQAITNSNDGTNLALVNSTPSVHSNSIIDDIVQNQFNQKNGVAYLEQTITTTVTTTTVKKILMQSGSESSLNDDIHITPRTAKMVRRSQAQTFSNDFDSDSDVIQTPRGRSTRLNNSKYSVTVNGSLNFSSPAQLQYKEIDVKTPKILPKTPKQSSSVKDRRNGVVTVSGKELQKYVPKENLNGDINSNLKNRNVSVSEHQRISLQLKSPDNKSTPKPDDFLFSLKKPELLVVKNIDELPEQ